MAELPAEIKMILARPRSDRFNMVLSVGFSALEEKDLPLAKACSEHIISRSGSGTGDLLRGLFLLSLICEAEGDSKKAVAIMARVCRGEF